MQKVQNSLPIETLIQGRYIVESLLGTGDFGNIYLVRDQLDKQDLFVLAEMINPHEREDFRFTLEYVSLASLKRGTLVHLYSCAIHLSNAGWNV